MNEKLKKLISDKEEQKKALAAQAETTEDVKELKALQENIKALNVELEVLREAENDTSTKASGADGGIRNDGGTETRSRLEARNSAAPCGSFSPMGTYSISKTAAATAQPEDVYATHEYRMAFRDYVVNGTPIPNSFREQRANQLTVVGDVGAVIPTTIMDKVIEEALAFGMILPRVTQTSYQGGVEIPVSEIKPTATWITETTASDTQKKEINSTIAFSYHMLECRVAVGLLTATVTLAVFENTIVKNIKEAMITALETSIISGSGSGQPKGILMETIDDGRIITLDESEIGSVKGWAKAEAAVPLAYETGAAYMMAKTTWESHLNGAVDASGQKLGFVSISDNQQRKLNGRDVLLTDYIKGFDKADAGDVFAVLVKLSDYVLNSNLNMTYKKYYNEDTNKWVHKSIMIADGKMADTCGIVYIKKAEPVQA